MSADAASPPPESSPSKLKPKIPFLIALVLGLTVGAASGAFVVGPALAKGIAPSTAHVIGEDGDGEPAKASGGEGKAGEGKGATAKQVYTLDNLVLNPAESGGTRFLLLSVAFETTDAALVEDMKARDAELRDVVLVTLGAKTVEQLADMKSRDALKTELTGATLGLFKRPKKPVVRVYFPQFVIQ